MRLGHMRDPQPLDRRHGQVLIDVADGVDHHRLTGRLAANEIARLRERVVVELAKEHAENVANESRRPRRHGLCPSCDGRRETRRRPASCLGLGTRGNTRFYRAIVGGESRLYANSCTYTRRRWQAGRVGSHDPAAAGESGARA